jgi:hypothetical protein
MRLHAWPLNVVGEWKRLLETLDERMFFLASERLTHVPSLSLPVLQP